jgi:hypothetical protein
MKKRRRGEGRRRGEEERRRGEEKRRGKEERRQIPHTKQQLIHITQIESTTHVLHQLESSSYVPLDDLGGGAARDGLVDHLEELEGQRDVGRALDEGGGIREVDELGVRDVG